MKLDQFQGRLDRVILRDSEVDVEVKYRVL